MSNPPAAADLVIDARWVVPVEPDGVVLEDHSVVVCAGRIAAVLPTPEAARAYSTRQRVTLREHVLIPGLVNLHTHAAMTLMRGLADDLPLMEWLKDHVWPVETEARVAGVRVRRHPARMRGDAARRGHLLQRHVFLSGGGGPRVPRQRHARRHRADRGRVPERLRLRRGRLPGEGARAARPARGRGAALVLHRAARAVHGGRPYLRADRDPRGGTGSADPHSPARDRGGGPRRRRGSRRAAARAPRGARTSQPAADRRSMRSISSRRRSTVSPAMDARSRTARRPT